jgi:hypothetical protein
MLPPVIRSTDWTGHFLMITENSNSVEIVWSASIEARSFIVKGYEVNALSAVSIVIKFVGVAGAMNGGSGPEFTSSRTSEKAVLSWH